MASVGDRRYRHEPRCFASPAADDLVAPAGGKVLGSAARARGDRLLIHGSLKIGSNDWDGDAVNGCGLSLNDAAEALIEGLCAAFTWTPQAGDLSNEEIAARDRIYQQRYGDPAWVEQRRGPRA
ncbi:MAG: hypothetical protein ACYTF0_02935 [Planctomycetota bacterium]|jgi:lipoate-protein ligase A